MTQGDANPAGAPQQSSMESFLDDYQLVRLFMAVGGLVHLAVFAWTGTWRFVLPFAVGLILTATHAGWSRLRRIRAPKSMLLLDLTVWGGITFLSHVPVLTTAILAFLAVVVVFFSDGRWMAGLLWYAGGWYAVAYFSTETFTVTAIGTFSAVALVVGGLAAMMFRVRTWLGRLDANRSQMLGTVSHELRNNLTGMLGMTEIVTTTEDMTREEAMELIGLAHQQAVDAGEIVEDLLTATHLERAALDVATETVDINHEVATTVRRFAGEGTEVATHLASDLLPAGGDTLRIRQILRNLVSNAVRYGGSTIRVTTMACGDRVHVTVSDDGDGVPPEDERTIFLPYRRSSRGGHSASVGLGLWISRQLAQAMEGDLAYRRVGESTEFVLTLRALEVDQDPEPRLRVKVASGAGLG